MIDQKTGLLWQLKEQIRW